MTLCDPDCGAILEAHPGWEIVAEAADGKEAIKKALETKPDVAVIDYSLPLLNGIEATRQIRKREPRTEVLIFTMHDEEILIRNVLEAGALGYLLKADAKTIRCRGGGGAGGAQAVLHRAGVADAACFISGKKGRCLRSNSVPREESVIKLIAEGTETRRLPMSSRSASRRSKVTGHRRFGNSNYLQPPTSCDTPFATSSLNSEEAQRRRPLLRRHAAVQGENRAGGEALSSLARNRMPAAISRACRDGRAAAAGQRFARSLRDRALRGMSAK